MNTTSCKILGCEPIKKDIFKVSLQPDEDIAFQAGQYLELLIPGEEYSFYSIANSPSKPCIELHIQHAGDESASSRIIEWLTANDRVSIKMPMGKCVLSSLPEENGPLLLLASGTGFSQIKALVEALLEQPLKRSVYFYWSARTLSGLYMPDLAETWRDSHDNFHFNAIISEHADWQDKQHLMFEAIKEDFNDLSHCQAICCGSPAMVYATLDELTSQGFRDDQMISDVFEYAPR